MNPIFRKLAKAGWILRTHGAGHLARYSLHRLFYGYKDATSVIESSRGRSTGQIFERLYRERVWMNIDNLESFSGSGSTVDYTAPFRAELARLARSRRLGSIFDAPCGDFNWMRLWLAEMERSGQSVAYHGGDIVASLVEQNRLAHGRDGIEFRVFDIATDAFPQADLWLCRDCIMHLSYAKIFAALRNFLDSGIEACLLTTHRMDGINHDVPDGGCRRLNLCQAPFNLPEPRALLRDYPDGAEERYVGLWHRDDLATAAPDWPVSREIGA